MLQVPKYILQKLLCAQCGDYLSCGPIGVNKRNEQICGRCYNTLPDDGDGKADYFRQSGLEALAEILVFPCRYEELGCKHTFQWNRGKDHESRCPYRHPTLPLDECLTMNNNNQVLSYDQFPKSEYKCEMDDVHVSIRCENDYSNNFLGDEKLKIRLDITGFNDSKLSLSTTNRIKHDVVLSCEILVSLETVPKVTFTYVTVKDNFQEHFYEKIPNLQPYVQCTTCGKNISTSEIFYCPFDHSICRQCKTNFCKICGRSPQSDSQYYCKNFMMGCKVLRPLPDIKGHEIDCEFNNFSCPLYNECNYFDSLNGLIQHFVELHKNHVIVSNELNTGIGRKDRNWYFHCFNKLFNCQYFYFDDRIEFIVKYIGGNNNARNYKYSVELLVENSSVFKKNEKCLGWNEAALGKGILFDLSGHKIKNIEARLLISSLIE